MVLSCQIKLNDRLNNFYVLFSEFNIVLDWQESIRYQVMMIRCLQQVDYLINKERNRESNLCQMIYTLFKNVVSLLML